MAKPELSVLIVNWNTRELLRRCLSTLFAHNGELSCEVIVVDNGSADGSAEMVATEFPQVHLLRNCKNRGFAAANNQAIALARGEYLCLLNSDTEVGPGVLAAMVAFLSEHPQAVACGPALRLPSGRLQTGGAGYALGLGTAFNYFFFLSRLFPERCRGIYLYQDHFVRHPRVVQVDWLAGACLMVRRCHLEVAGLLDETFHMYAEDAEWCQRLGRVGDLFYLPHLEILHLHGASSAAEENVSVRWLEATFALFSRQQGNLRGKLFQGIFAAGLGLRMVLYGAGSLLRPALRPRARAMAAYARYATVRMLTP